jgi:hypothetical protein
MLISTETEESKPQNYCIEVFDHLDRVTSTLKQYGSKGFKTIPVGKGPGYFYAFSAIKEDLTIKGMTREFFNDEPITYKPYSIWFRDFAPEPDEISRAYSLIKEDGKVFISEFTLDGRPLPNVHEAERELL